MYELDDEKIVAGYDPHIMRRLMRYLRPYTLLVIVAAIALAIATTGDLLLPVVVQRAVDNQLVAVYTRIPTRFMSSAELSGIRERDRAELGDATYVRNDRLVAVSGVARQALIQSGVIEERGYYLFPINPTTRTALGDRFGQLVTDSGEVEGAPTASMSVEALESLDDATRRAVRREDLAALRRTTLLFCGLLVSILVFTFAQVYLMALTGQRVMKDMRMEIFGHTIRQRLGYLSHHPVGRLVTRVTNDVETVNQLFTDVLINLLRSGALMVGSIVTLMMVNWRLGLVTLATLPPVLILTLFFRRRARDAYRRVRSWVSRLNAFLSEHLSGMSVVQLFVRERKVMGEFDDRNRELLKANLTEIYVFALFRPMIDLLSSVSVAVVIYFGARFLLAGIVSLGVLIAFVNLIRRFYQPIMTLSEQFTVLQSAMAGAERVFGMINTVDRIPDNGTFAPKTIQGKVVFDHVWFSYREGEPVIRDLSFTINEGETVAIVGYTGAGKTTIANLLARLWDIQKGRILLDGVDIREYRIDALRTLVQPIQQDVFLFSDTIKANVALGMDLSTERLEEIAAMVQADRFVHRLSSGYDTRLTEGATNISTGERQLLSFARILAHDPRIIIMDEATANVDTETERLIQKAVEAVMANRTALVIAHRLSTIKNADRILVLSQGELVEEGDHDSLIAAGGLYYNLYRLQYQESSGG